MTTDPGYSIDDMIEEAWLMAATRYTVAESNLTRVADLAANDFGEKHPGLVGFVPFIAGAIYMKYKQYFKDMKARYDEGQKP